MEPGTRVSLSYRGSTFGRARAKNRDSVNALVAKGKIDLLLKSTVDSIGPNHAVLTLDVELKTIRNDAVIVCAGGILPFDFLRACGIGMETKYGTA